MVVCWMAAKFFQSPFNIPPPLDGNQKFSILKKGVSLCYHFGKIKKFNLHLLSWAAEKFRSPSNGVDV
jgi:hypothetical protein